MLVLSRACDSVVHIGPDIRVKILAIQRQRVKLGVEAPRDIRVWRDEVAPELPPADVAGPGAPGREDHRESPILVVEDDPDHARLIRRVLVESDYPTHTVASGAAALEVLGVNGQVRADGQPVTEGQSPFLVLLDYYLPDGPGLNVLKCIRSDPRLRATPVIVLSAEDRESVVARCLEAGANAFVPKSTDWGRLRQSILRIVAFWSGNCLVPRPAARPSAR